MTFFDLYGTKNDDIKDVKKHVEMSLNVNLIESESDFCGVTYRSSKQDKDSILLYENYDLYEEDEEDRWKEPKFKEFFMLVYISWTSQPDYFRERFRINYPELVWLRRTLIQDIDNKKVTQVLHEYGS